VKRGTRAPLARLPRRVSPVRGAATSQRLELHCTILRIGLLLRHGLRGRCERRGTTSWWATLHVVQASGPAILTDGFPGKQVRRPVVLPAGVGDDRPRGRRATTRIRPNSSTTVPRSGQSLAPGRSSKDGSTGGRGFVHHVALPCQAEYTCRKSMWVAWRRLTTCALDPLLVLRIKRARSALAPEAPPPRHARPTQPRLLRDLGLPGWRDDDRP